MNKREEHMCMISFQSSGTTTAAYITVSRVFAVWPKCNADSGFGSRGRGDQAPTPLSPRP